MPSGSHNGLYASQEVEMGGVGPAHKGMTQ